MTFAAHAGFVAIQELDVAVHSGRITDGFVELLIVFAFFALGVFLIYKGADTYRLSRLIANTPTENVGGLAVGRTELEGKARPAGTVFEQPFTDGGCLYVKYGIKERRKSSGEGSKYKWVTLDSGEYGTPFELEDETGSVEVKATSDTKYEISDENTTTITVGKGESSPEKIRKFLNGEVDGPWNPSGDPERSRKQKYIQEVLPVHGDAYVFGGAKPKRVEDVDGVTANEARLEIVRDGATDRFVVSDMGEEELAEGLGRRGPGTIVAGLLLSAGTLYVLANDLLVMF